MLINIFNFLHNPLCKYSLLVFKSIFNPVYSNYSHLLNNIKFLFYFNIIIHLLYILQYITYNINCYKKYF